MKVLFDWDGTLIDSRERLYRLFQHLTPTSLLTFDQYWDIKRGGISHEQILRKDLGYEDAEVKAFESQWMSLIEHPEWLALDKPFEGVSDFLTKLCGRHDVYVVTNRQHREPVFEQLTNLRWQNVFRGVLVTQQRTDKKTLVESALKVDASDWMIGDTGEDIRTGNALGMQTAAVLSGFLSREKLSRYQPDLFLEYVTDFKK